MISADLDFYITLLKEKSGLIISAEKQYLLDSRLTPVDKKWDFANIDAMTSALRINPKREIINDIVEAMTTNETSFFRDTKPFDRLRDVMLPILMQQRQNTRKIRIWCAACSSGQEPYSIAMMLRENEGQYLGWDIEILATDISNQILDQAREGFYSQFEVQRGLPITTLMKYFTQDGEKWRINDDIKRMVHFEYGNLLEPLTSMGTIDIIFCRNVLIYFDQETKKMVLENMAKQMPQDGFLAMGGAETILGITDTLKIMPDQQAIYVRDDWPDLTPPEEA